MEQQRRELIKYFTASGKFIQGDTQLEVLESLRNSSSIDARIDMDQFLEVLRLRIYLFNGTNSDELGDEQLLSELENIGFLLRL